MRIQETRMEGFWKLDWKTTEEYGGEPLPSFPLCDPAEG